MDTSVWIDHLRRGSAPLQQLLAAGEVVTHPFVIGEIACGGLANRAEILGLVRALPEAIVATHEEALAFLERQVLHGKGLAWIDVHLLVSALLSRVPIWTRDKALNRAAAAFGVAHRREP